MNKHQPRCKGGARTREHGPISYGFGHKPMMSSAHPKNRIQDMITIYSAFKKV